MTQIKNHQDYEILEAKLWTPMTSPKAVNPRTAEFTSFSSQGMRPYMSWLFASWLFVAFRIMTNIPVVMSQLSRSAAGLMSVCHRNPIGCKNIGREQD